MLHNRPNCLILIRRDKMTSQFMISHKVFNFARGRAVIHISYWWDELDVCARADDDVGHSLQLESEIEE